MITAIGIIAILGGLVVYVGQGPSLIASILNDRTGLNDLEEESLPASVCLIARGSFSGIASLKLALNNRVAL